MVRTCATTNTYFEEAFALTFLRRFILRQIKGFIAGMLRLLQIKSDFRLPLHLVHQSAAIIDRQNCGKI